MVCTTSLRFGIRPLPARENSAPRGSNLVPPRDFVDEAELPETLQGNPIGRDLDELHPAGESGKHAALGRAERDFWSFHRSNVPPRLVATAAFLRARRGSNSRPSRSKRDALSTELRAHVNFGSADQLDRAPWHVGDDKREPAELAGKINCAFAAVVQR